MDVDLKGRVAIVTGAGRGLGRAYALELASRGAAVLVNDMPGGTAGDVVAEIEEAGGTAAVSEHDVSTQEGGAAIVADAEEGLGGVDVVVNNAGVLDNAMFVDLTPAKLDRILNIHVKGTVYVAQPAFRAMREKGYGRIVNVSSNTSFGMAGLSNYAAAKAGIVGLTKSMALEGAADGIAVNAVMPNATTPIMVDEPIPGFEEDTRFVAAFEGVSGRFEPELVAPLVAYLASEACGWTGEVLSSLGGRYSRVFYGVTEGWLSDPSGPVSADDIAAHAEEIFAIGDDFLVPASIRDEFEAVAGRLAG
jgi:NAD(P)-dependent dehydrogenase (short-subunit alcohol dehydrogenase family)